ncbi:hypothetical protein EDEG_03380 [Edhazardia aedis USNM 41457]|uniref:Dehydrogenase E1 component domain-containing protein n=1 Tax=Edhazardia aedis (strain USNM 41457) TaxID=1003232 RepID=J9D3R6_EDHAE|nr:hypothetical protein EDEG_03380 [Edhazardia aedis USNM 41457]|eukprot:EJW02184.1 hypothetical protein EDEG_03380 [Edhazardia aedis USNM 41457]
MHVQKIDTGLISLNLIDRSKIPNEVTLELDDLLFLFKEMYEMRVFEETAFKNYNKMRGFLHLSIGQESIYASIYFCLKKLGADAELFDFIGSYRCHCLAYITGSSYFEIASELLGKKTGMCKGKGGSMHLYNKNFYGGHGIVGAQVPLGAGLAFAINYAKKLTNDNKNINDTLLKSISKKKAVFAFYGDGATNQGQVYETYNMALIYKLPIVFIIENNHYGMWTKNLDVSDTDDFYSRWRNMPGMRIRSDDTFTLLSVFQQIMVNNEFNYPFIIQIDTYRYCGHSMNDMETYRTEKEKQLKTQEDRINQIKNILIENGHLETVSNLEMEINKNIENCFELAIKSEFPNDNELMEDIYLK